MARTVQPVPRSRPGAWLDERLGLHGLAYAVPEHANSLPYLLGGISLTGFLILFVTGIYLAQFYHPHPTDAHQSVVHLITGRVTVQEPAGELHWLDRTKPIGQMITVMVLIVLSSAVGFVPVRSRPNCLG